MAWLSGYSKRKKITLSGKASGVQTDYQMQFDVTYASDMQADFSDLRFTRLDGETLLDAWLESKTDSVSAVVWVETDTPADGADTDIYMYYGNGSALSDWDIEATFVFGDDFPGTTIDSNKWTVESGAWSIDNNRLYCNAVGAEALIRTTSYNSFTNNVLECDWQYLNWQSGGREGILTRFQDLSNYYATWLLLGAITGRVKALVIEDRVGGIWGTVNYGAQDFTTGTWYDLESLADGTTLKAVFDDVEKVSTTRSDFSSGGIGFRTWYDDIYVDNVRVRKYVSNPATYAFGSEESETEEPTEEPTEALDIADYKTVSWTVSKGVADALWVFSAQVDKHTVPAFFETIEATATDHIDNPHTPFVGIIPAADLTLATSADKATLTGYDYGWYLTVQYVPSDERTTEADTNPSDTITSLLGGTSWATVTGIEPHRINTVAEWEDIKKSFEFGDRCTRWQAIEEICAYCNFVFVVKWRDVSGTWRPCAYFVHEADIDSRTAGLDIPAAVTITDPDPHLMSGVSVKDSPEHKYNRVLVTGYDTATAAYYYATAQTAEVSAGTAVPIEYVYADAAVNAQVKADAKAQELLDFFQASSKVYTARFKRRMDLELYQKISFSGYNKIDPNTMRITKISYSRSAAADTVEIEFSKDQAIQQLRRLARAVSPDYVSGAQDMISGDLSNFGLIDVFDMPIAGGTAEDDMWTTSGSYAQLFDAAPINMQGWSLDGVSGVRGSAAADFSLWGGDSDGESLVEFLRWHTYETGQRLHKYLEISSELYINNDPHAPKIYFDIDSFRPTYLQAYTGSSLKSLELIIGNNLMMRLTNYEDSRRDFIGCYEDLLLTKDLVAGGRIEGDGNNNLVFWDNATGQKTLSELAAGASGGDGWHVYKLWSTTEYVAAGYCYYWYWTLPYSGTDMSVIPAVRAHLGGELACYPNITAFVIQQNFGTNGIYIMAYNGSYDGLNMSIDAIVIWS